MAISSKRLVEVINSAGPSVAAVQVNTLFLTDYSTSLPTDLRQLAEKHDIILIGDL